MRRLLHFIVIAAVLAPAAARAQDGDERIASLESRLDALERENRELRESMTAAPSTAVDYRVFMDGEGDTPTTSLEERVKVIEEDLEKEAKAAAKKKEADAQKPTLKWTGRIHADYWSFPQTSPGANAFENGDPNESVQDRFLFRRLRIGVQGDIPDNMLYKLEVDFNNPNNPQLKDNFIGWKDLPFLQELLVGNQKRPYGLDHLNSSRYNVFMERPDIVEAFNQDARRFGICSYGVSDDERYNWRFGAYMSQDLPNTGIAFATPVVEDYQAEFAGRLANTLWYDEASDGRSYIHWGISGTTVSTDPSGSPSSTAIFQSRVEARTSQRWLNTGIIDGADHYELLGLEALVNLGPFQWVGEIEQVWMHRINDQDLYFHGGYFYLSWFLTGEHMPWNRELGILDRVQPFENFFLVDTAHDGVCAGWGAWQFAVRYSHADLTDQDVRGGIANEVTFGMNWYWNAYAKMQFNAIYGEITERQPVAGFSDAYFTILGTRFMVDF